MHSLSTLGKLNEKREADFRKRVAIEGTFNRHCSYSGDVESGVVLHSAKRRSTAFVSAGDRAKAFLVKWFGTNSAEARDEIVEAYFAY